ncbi:DUF294 nucleotidyltransferase-like domain-containing protein [Candidatus Halobeggiatoa sp. HSG11]|nr:DUF294 nucleotidyltransferase-like domain-containing protein [Candidatus Halobeggiatoa sp. HSG11]
MSNTIEFLSKLHPFQDISEEELEQVAKYLKIKSLQTNEYLFQRGESYHKTVYIVQQGRLERHRQSGQIIILEIGDFIGLANFMDASSYLSSVKALTDVKLLGLPASELQELENLCPPLFEGFNRIIAKYIRDRGNAPRPVTSHALCLPARSIMKSPLATCGPYVTLLEAYELMRKRKIGSLGVTNEENKMLGLINFISLADAMLVQGSKVDTPVLEVVCKKNNTVSPDTPMWQIEEIQHDQNLKYIIVVEDNEPVGVISQTDILNNLIAHQGLLFTEISTATKISELAAFYQRIDAVASEARENNHRASTAVRNISEFHLALQRRCVELTLQEMENDGLGMPPTKYAFILMGSGSRKEMMLNPDQDNAIILDDSLKSDVDKQWFQTFCERVNAHLDEIGYIFCPGNIMAKSNVFHKTLSQWKQQISHVTHLPNKKAARWANVFFDFSYLYGDDELAAALSKHVIQELKQNPRLLKMMVEDDAEGQAAVGWFNRLVTRRDQSGKGKVDIKRNGLRIIADAARIYSLKHGIESRNTADRLTALVRQGLFNIESMKSVSASFEELLDLLLEHQLKQMQTNQELDKLIDPGTLSPLHHESLRMAMRTIKQFQEKLQAEFDVNDF